MIQSILSIMTANTSTGRWIAPSNPKATVIKANVPVEDKSFSPWIWVGVSLAGLLIGFLLNYFV